MRKMGSPRLHLDFRFRQLILLSNSQHSASRTLVHVSGLHSHPSWALKFIGGHPQKLMKAEGSGDEPIRSSEHSEVPRDLTSQMVYRATHHPSGTRKHLLFPCRRHTSGS